MPLKMTKKAPARREIFPLLRSDIDRCSVGYGLPNLIHFFVGDCDTAICPVSEPMDSTDGTVAIRQAMNEHIASR